MTYVRNAWYVAGWEQDLAPEKPFALTILGDRLVIWRSASGAVHALEDKCVHRFAPLSLGRCEGEHLRCMYHGLLFDAGGKVAQIPGQDLVPARARVRAYPVVVRHSWIWVWMGDVEAADPALIPPAVGFDDPDYILGCGFLDYQAEARLINDNLLDFSHLTYVHAASFGAGPEFAASQPKVTPLERGVRVERWLENTHGSGNRKSEQLIDGWSSYDFLLPGVLLMWSANYPAGTAKRLNYAPPPMVEAIAGLNFTSQAVTPLTDKTSRYFFSWGPHRKFGDEAMRDHMMGIAGMAFAEDKAMIEAQQKVIDTTPAQDVMPTAHDRGVTLFNRLVEKLADAATIELREAVG
ncbi:MULTISPECIES: aromatic ring-hydroxylating dioxygenase subunit alpha [unclassified Novosphingobium]|uniref:aromatic ring-hydroxylating dioxygenase subunit alpha n=1 Tax=unclassified Novosphingobium TaxID=2644732 RepID=UPI000868AB57|nr:MULTISPECIES: aromatic ring-hydroxylating dioxygenase subunit alpha [unclassified Novosphingobium]MBN9144532.1 aromatic ring-hydroxylating dioxygenase subunit alpha [Novosphingobium sp.]MDR6707863.1 vanillate O-demethylase monooxygenase subunit [Novosphingobium sp. 1748]ODU84077.1 MAG: (2Fe-2S)-binding protein [Novosphingobium sp. SCN 63-17]OJX93630.1 MAG: (2Fe-2S)-binding protein [Novosphingobium sp. 63-713]